MEKDNKTSIAEKKITCYNCFINNLKTAKRKTILGFISLRGCDVSILGGVGVWSLESSFLLT